MSTSARPPRLPRNPESTTEGILLQSDIAVTGVLTHFFQQAAADSSRCSRKVKLVDLTLRQGAGNRRRPRREAEAFKDPPMASNIYWMKGGLVIKADNQLQIYGTLFHDKRNIYFSKSEVLCLAKIWSAMKTLTSRPASTRLIRHDEIFVLPDSSLQILA